MTGSLLDIHWPLPGQGCSVLTLILALGISHLRIWTAWLEIHRLSMYYLIRWVLWKVANTRTGSAFRSASILLAGRWAPVAVCPCLLPGRCHIGLLGGLVHTYFNKMSMTGPDRLPLGLVHGGGSRSKVLSPELRGGPGSPTPYSRRLPDAMKCVWPRVFQQGSDIHCLPLLLKLSNPLPYHWAICMKKLLKC